MSQDANTLNQHFIAMEHKWLKHWNDRGIIEKYLHKNDSSGQRFSFQDGPITANNPMGVHHAWGRTYKDMWQKFYNLFGYRQRFQNGFDCQGLWVEVEVEKELGLRSKKDIENLVPGDPKASIAKFVQLCKDRVHKFAGIQTDQSKRLGYFMDWERSYFTMSEDNNYMIWHFLKTCHEHGWMYKGHESVPWCPRCETAISQHEMLTEDYKEVVHDSIYMEFKLLDAENEYLLVWTTTPWTIPANIAVAVDKDIDYSLVKGTSGDCFWVAQELVEKIFGDGEYTVIKTVKGKALAGRQYQGLFDELEIVKRTASENPDTFHRIVLTDPQIMPITTTEGTGLVHTAVSAGTEDFRLGKKLGLPMIPVIGDSAEYLPHMGFLAGKNAKKHPEIIFDHLKERETNGENLIFKIERYKHRYPGCWRCKAELVWKVADEWYIAMDKPSSTDVKDTRTLRERMIDVTKKITWMPSFGLERELDWLANMHDWLISKKNRYWGLALPIYECDACGTFEVIGSKEELKGRAVAGWDIFEGKTPHKPYIDEVNISCSSCKKPLHRIGDVGNPWLDAGIVPYSTMKNGNTGEPLYLSDKEEWRKWFPADFITESFPGQFKNWFYAMIAMSTVLEDTNPYQRVLGFGTLLGEDGRPMHKSWGNSIAFHEGADEIGVDVMRWMYVRHNPAENLLFGYKKADEVRRLFYLVLYNSYKFYLQSAELAGYRYTERDFSAGEAYSVLDRWMLTRLNQLTEGVAEDMRAYAAREAAAKIESFVGDFSTWYIRRSRDRVRLEVSDAEDRTRCLDVMSTVLVQLSVVLSPFFPFLPEEIYTRITGKESVHLAQWPEQLSLAYAPGIVETMEILRQAVEIGHRSRKELGIKVRQPLASATIRIWTNFDSMNDEDREGCASLLAAELNVKQVLIERGTNAEGIEVTFDTNITPELAHEGALRELVRTIQSMRKKLGVSYDAKIALTIPEEFRSDEASLIRQVNAGTVSYGVETKVTILS